MITEEKIRIYKYYKGDIDGWARLGTPEQKSEMIDQDWLMIEDLIQSIRLFRKGRASENYIESVYGKAIANFSKHEVLRELEEIL
ncbi:hypothetical protein [Pedobacter frigidisoli]|uniref:hypothetical protein n=1 Tax=Pedobacter frigidisoli TaxID=2530455 RepID=UPI002930310B|nr:hypothetical protein [Pedobacter frigidisoli]